MRSPPWLALALVFLAGACASAAPELPPRAAAAAAPDPRAAGPRAAELRAACETFRAERGIVGMAVAVLDDGAVVLDEPFGLADRERELPATRSTLFRLGSISKPVTAAIALRLAEAGTLDLDADVRALVPEARHLPPMTLAQLLAHTAGVRHYRPDRRDNSTAHRTTTEALALFVGDPLLSAPGAKYSYSTHGYTLVVAALERASGRSFVELVREHVRDRGTPSLDCEVLVDAKPARSALYELEKDGGARLEAEREDNSWKYGGGGMESTALDLARFGDAVRTATLVSPAARERMWSPTALADGKQSHYGLGWRIARDRGEVLHTGSQQGAHSALVIVPAEGLVIAVTTNTNGGKPQELVPRLRELLARSPTMAVP
jgi:CubicO group peptidase (beta-lactamase class C family)